MSPSLKIAISFILGVILVIIIGASGPDDSGGVYTGDIVGCVTGSPDSEFTKGINRLNASIKDYKTAAAATGVPWEVIAALHYREHNFYRDFPKNGQGPFQLSDLHASNPNAPELKNFQLGAKYAAKFLRDKVADKLVPGKPLDADLEVLKTAFWKYNGSQKIFAPSPDKASYVMNFYDKDHYRMLFKNGKPDGRSGAFTVYTLLKNARYDNNGTLIALETDCPPVVAGQVSGTGTAFQMRVAQNAIATSNQLKPAKNGMYKILPGFSGEFVCTHLVLKAYSEAGAALTSSGLNLGMADQMLRYFQTRQGGTILIANGSGLPQPGDVLFYKKNGASRTSSHVGIVIGSRGNQVISREANVHNPEQRLDVVNGRLQANWKASVVGWGRLLK